MCACMFERVVLCARERGGGGVGGGREGERERERGREGKRDTM
jgi:hypothetical protein